MQLFDQLSCYRKNSSVTFSTYSRTFSFNSWKSVVIDQDNRALIYRLNRLDKTTASGAFFGSSRLLEICYIFILETCSPLISASHRLNWLLWMIVLKRPIVLLLRKVFLSMQTRTDTRFQTYTMQEVFIITPVIG